LQFKVSTLEQQITLLQEGNDSLNTELSQQLNRYAELRRSRTDEVSALQSKLDQKTAEYDREVERARLLHNSNQDMERKLTEALARNRDLQSNEAANTRAFQEEMQVCKDLLAQYEKIADEAKTRVAEIEKEEEHIRRELSRREESLLTQTERERERAETSERKVEELEEVLQRVQTGELSMAETSFTQGRMSMSPGPAGMSSLMLSPTASIVSKLQRGGRSITEVYADYVRLQKELQQEKQEKARLETTLNDIFNEIQDRVSSCSLPLGGVVLTIPLGPHTHPTTTRVRPYLCGGSRIGQPALRSYG
jgi:nucleoprotein TPR